LVIIDELIIILNNHLIHFEISPTWISIYLIIN